MLVISQTGSHCTPYKPPLPCLCVPLCRVSTFATREIDLTTEDDLRWTIPLESNADSDQDVASFFFVCTAGADAADYLAFVANSGATLGTLSSVVDFLASQSSHVNPTDTCTLLSTPEATFTPCAILANQLVQNTATPLQSPLYDVSSCTQGRLVMQWDVSVANTGAGTQFELSVRVWVV